MVAAFRGMKIALRSDCIYKAVYQKMGRWLFCQITGEDEGVYRLMSVPAKPGRIKTEIMSIPLTNIMRAPMGI